MIMEAYPVAGGTSNKWIAFEKAVEDAALPMIDAGMELDGVLQAMHDSIDNIFAEWEVELQAEGTTRPGVIKESLLTEGDSATYYGSGGDDEFEVRISVKYSDDGSAAIDWDVKKEKWNSDERRMETVTVHEGEDNDDLKLSNLDALWDKAEEQEMEEAIYNAISKFKEGEYY